MRKKVSDGNSENVKRSYHMVVIFSKMKSSCNLFRSSCNHLTFSDVFGYASTNRFTEIKLEINRSLPYLMAAKNMARAEEIIWWQSYLHVIQVHQP